MGGNLVVHGDGTRERQVRGPETSASPPTMTSVRGRRYECQRCGACMLVVPRGILPREESRQKSLDNDLEPQRIELHAAIRGELLQSLFE